MNSQITSADEIADLARPRVMGILNVTPDSFSDGGRFTRVADAIDQARRMLEEGADILDVGGESTRPGAADVSLEHELERVIPVIEALRERFETTVSIDTSKPDVMRAAVSAGAGMINDVNALRADGALDAAAACGVPVCVMHMQGSPRTMQAEPRYRDVLGEVLEFLMARAEACQRAGIPRQRILIDPGFGFGKTLAHNLRLMAGLETFTATGLPVLVGVSRKSMIGALLDREVGERLYGTIALEAIAALKGAAVIRAHDVRAAVEAMKIGRALRGVSD